MELMVGALLEVLDASEASAGSERDRLDEALAARCAAL
jgi:hypothetical protein